MFGKPCPKCTDRPPCLRRLKGRMARKIRSKTGHDRVYRCKRCNQIYIVD